MLGEHLTLVTLHHNLQLALSKTIRIGDTKYHIQCRSFGTLERQLRQRPCDLVIPKFQRV